MKPALSAGNRDSGVANLWCFCQQLAKRLILLKAKSAQPGPPSPKALGDSQGERARIGENGPKSVEIGRKLAS
jgi:hypothetical protein